MFLRKRFAGLMLCSMLLAGCDDPPSPESFNRPAEPATQPQAASSMPRRPTTQELLTSPWKTMPVPALPFVMQVPASWEISPLADTGPFMVEGYGPNGFVQVRIASRPGFQADMLDGFVRSAKSAAEATKDKLKKFEYRAGDPMAVIDRQIAGDPGTIPVLDEAGNLVEKQGIPLRWSRLLLVKSGERYECYELIFDSLSMDQFEKDRDFLQKIADSLSYDASRKS